MLEGKKRKNEAEERKLALEGNRESYYCIHHILDREIEERSYIDGELDQRETGRSKAGKTKTGR